MSHSGDTCPRHPAETHLRSSHATLPSMMSLLNLLVFTAIFASEGKCDGTDNPAATVTVRETVTQTAPSGSATQNHAPPPPPPFPFPPHGAVPPPGYMPPLMPMSPPPPMMQAGSVVSPFAAVLCILTVAGCYWAFKYLPNMSTVRSQHRSRKYNTRFLLMFLC